MDKKGEDHRVHKQRKCRRARKGFNEGTDNSEVANWSAEENQGELLEYPARRRYSLNSRGHGPVFEKLVVTQMVQKFHRLTQNEGS